MARSLVTAKSVSQTSTTSSKNGLSGTQSSKAGSEISASSGVDVQRKTAENLVAQVEGDIEDVDEVMRITKIRLHYRLRIPPGSREKVDRVMTSYAEKCPAY